jgi:cytochrome b561
MPLEIEPRGSDMRRYSVGARWFHWITAVLMFIVIPLGWIFGAFKTKPGHPDVYVAPFPGTPGDYAAAHMSVGLVLFAIVAARIFYRIMNPPPVLPSTMGRWEQRLAQLTHWLLYAVLIIMPVSGYIMSSGDKPPISFLGLIDMPKIPISQGVGKAAAIVHVLITQFVVYGLIVLHLAGTAWHLFVRRDGLLSRMLPRQANERD